MFVINSSIAPTNNKVESVIRPILTCHKVSSSSKSQKGAKYFTIVCSILGSYRNKIKFKAILNLGNSNV